MYALLDDAKMNALLEYSTISLSSPHNVHYIFIKIKHALDLPMKSLYIDCSRTF